MKSRLTKAVSVARPMISLLIAPSVFVAMAAAGLVVTSLLINAS
jgi:hypothetical protein